MGIFSWLSDRFGEGDRSRDGDEHREQPATPMGAEHSPAPVGEQQPTAPIGAGHSSAPVGEQHPEAPIGAEHSSAPVGEQQPEAPEGEAASSEEEPKAPTFTDFTVRPVTIERLGLLFDSFGWKWSLDDDGDIASRWNGHNFYFRMVGAHHDVLSVVGFWKGTPREDQREEVMFRIEEWHRTHLWPTCALREVNGELESLAELNLDVEMGMTDQQLYTQCRCALGTTLEFFDELNEHLGVPESDDEGRDSSES